MLQEHSLQIFPSSPRVLLKIDYKNAPNSIRRDTFLGMVRDQFPEVYPFVWQCYNSPSTLESVCNIKMDGAVWSQATLPTSKGGLGIRRSQDLALPAFLSSTYAASDLVRSLLPANEVDGTTNLTEGMDLWRKRGGNPLPSEELRILQRVWDEALIDKSFNFVFSSVYGMKPS